MKSSTLMKERASQLLVEIMRDKKSRATISWKIAEVNLKARVGLLSPVRSLTETGEKLKHQSRKSQILTKQMEKKWNLMLA